jgi:hypothetical protein
LRLGGRRKAQREEEQRVVAEQSADAEHPHLRGLTQRGGGPGAEKPGRRTHGSGNRERHRGELERRHGSGRDREQRKQRPHQDRRETDEGGGAVRHSGSQAKRSCPEPMRTICAIFRNLRLWIPGSVLRAAPE